MNAVERENQIQRNNSILQEGLLFQYKVSSRTRKTKKVHNSTYTVINRQNHRLERAKQLNLDRIKLNLEN